MTLNSLQLFPLEEADSTTPLRAIQLPRSVDTLVYLTNPSSLAAFPVVELDNTRIVTTDMATHDGFREYTVEIGIIAVDGHPVSLEGLSMGVVEAPAFGLAFGDITIVPKGQSCGADIACLMAKMLDRVRAIEAPAWATKPWGGKKGCHGGKKDSDPLMAGDEHPHPHPEYHQSHRHHHGHHKEGPQQTLFNRIVAQVLLPILVGIVAGMSVSLVGLVIGHIFVMLYRRIRGIKSERRSCRAARRAERRERKERARLARQMGDGEVEKGLLANEEPPAYADDVECAAVVVEKE